MLFFIIIILDKWILITINRCDFVLDRNDSHSLEGESEPDFNTLSLHSPPRMEKERDVAARSDISADSIERNMASGPGSERFERAQARWLEDMRARGVKIVQVTYPRTANNDKELSVVRGELLEVIKDKFTRIHILMYFQINVK